MKKELFNITGMTCSACSNRVYKAVSALDGVNDANVNFLKNHMAVSFDDNTISVKEIMTAVKKAGYGIYPQEKLSPGTGKENPDTMELGKIKFRLFVSFLFTVPLFCISMAHMAGLPFPDFFPGPENILVYPITQFMLTIPVIFINFKYYRTGFKTLLSGSPNMDSLIAIGSGAAVVFGLYAIYGMGSALGRSDMAAAHSFAMNIYFESAAMILTLITLGKFFEIRAKGKTSDAIVRLMDLTPKKATVVRGSAEQVILLEEIRTGDILTVRAGECVPADGIITDGYGFLDESALSGESLPLEKHAGDSVTGATINKSGHFLMCVTRVGDDTVLAQIIRMVEEATSSKAPIARLADIICGIFVPLVIVIAVAASFIWLLLGYGLEFALSTGISVLVVSCPCALGLATPAAIMVGTGRGAENGILFKSAEALETVQAIDTVVLDKTGTITEGKPTVTDIVAAGENSVNELLAVAASLEKLSEHPLGMAIVCEADRRGAALFKVTDFVQIPGRGITGTIDSHHCTAGNIRMLQDEGIIPDDAILAESDSFAAQGKTIIYCTRKKNLLGIIAVADVIKNTSCQAVYELETMGIDVIMVTGDNAKVAEVVQHKAGISLVLSEALPQDKEREISRLQKQGKKIAMVGDGINDSPALARADIGIAIGAGADIAIESADIVLMKSNLLDIVAAIQLSKAVMRTIRQNLFWAFFYNCIGIPIAAGVFYNICGLTLNPIIAAAAMSLSSVSVVTNALRLRRFTPKQIQSAAKEDYIMKKSIVIEGMSCGHCAGSVEKALCAIPGVTNAKVNLALKTADLETCENVSDDAIKTAVTDIGFKVLDIR